MTASSVGKLRSVLCVLTCTAVILSFYSASASSFGNLAVYATAGDRTVHPEVWHVYRGGQSCVTITPTGQSKPVVDLGLYLREWERHKYIKTVLVYLPKVTSVDDITIQALSNIGNQPLTLTGPLQETNSSMDIYRWEGYEVANTIRITGQSGQEMSLCLVKVYDKTLAEYCECSDPCHTNGDALCTSVCSSISADTCPRVNVALGKPAKMDSSYKQSMASYAVNGITGTTFSAPGYTNDQTQWNCVHTNVKRGRSYWQVDLGNKYTINHLTVYRRGSKLGRERMEGVTVSVDNQICTTIYDMPEDKQDLFCDSASLNGQVVRFNNENTFISLCEVQVWGCKPEWYGPNCEKKCGHCQSSCDPATGHCDTCQPGYHGQRCEDTCSSDCAGSPSECHQNGTCKGCRDGLHGDMCHVRCGHCQSGLCTQSTGHCRGDCKPNWDGPECNMCVDGKYGLQCDQDCGTGCLNTCNKQTGQCSCRPGYMTGYCNQKCPIGSYGQNCGLQCNASCEDRECHHVRGQCQCKAGRRMVNNKCQPCADGTYGRDCGKKCGAGCQTTCEKERGTCDCKRGYVAGLCNQECPKGSFGQDCGQQCDEHCQGGECHHVTGQCQCTAGYQMVDTDCQRCRDGFHGDKCHVRCGHCQSGFVPRAQDTVVVTVNRTGTVQSISMPSVKEIRSSRERLGPLKASATFAYNSQEQRKPLRDIMATSEVSDASPRESGHSRGMPSTPSTIPDTPRSVPSHHVLPAIGKV